MYHAEDVECTMLYVCCDLSATGKKVRGRDTQSSLGFLTRPSSGWPGNATQNLVPPFSLIGEKSLYFKGVDMADSDDDTADISNALLLEDVEDKQEEALLPNSKRRKTILPTENPFDDLDVFPNEAASKTKLSGSSFKNMGIHFSTVEC
jgi:hypothetical protein